MKALCVLYGGRLESEAFEKLLPGGAGQAGASAAPLGAGKESAFALAFAAARAFPGTEKIVFLGVEGAEYPALPFGIEIETVLRPSWTRKSLLEEISRAEAGFELCYFAWVDSPLLDAELAGALAERHLRYAAEYSYADGWPYGFAPELLAPGTSGILAKIAENADAPVERDALFELIQKDINSFDIETEISPLDLRPYRLCLAADSKRNLLLLSRLMEAGLSSAKDAAAFIAEKPELLRTLPAFFNIQVSGVCPQACSLCPWPRCGGDIPRENAFMPREAFGELLDKIEAFAGDAVIDLSLWGEVSLHPERAELIGMVLARPALSLVIETSGIGWKEAELADYAQSASRAAARKNHMAPLSWIVSLDAHDPERYKELRGPGFAEARSCAQTLLQLFPGNSYVQALRVKDFEDDIEHFYRFWKDALPGASAAGGKAGNNNGAHIIIQKYDDFAGALPKLQASDLSPVKRRPCWHVQRDMNILLDGKVPCCREDLAALKGEGGKPLLGNVFAGDLSAIWERGAALYQEHCKAQYPGICAGCDEYYTYNF